jgi:flagellar basal-body rod modification protein FlgD
LSGAVAKELDRNAFMNLMIVQLQNQDPLKPLEDKEFLAQLAQFSSLEQMQQVSSKMDVVAAGMQIGNVISLVGHTITAQSPTEDESISGVVSGVVYEDGMAQLTVGNHVINPLWITKIDGKS